MSDNGGSFDSSAKVVKTNVVGCKVVVIVDKRVLSDVSPGSRMIDIVAERRLTKR